MQTDLFGNVPEIVIDIHETTGKRMNSVKHLISMLEKNEINYVIQKIPVGDILGVEGIAIERKTVNDFVNTLKGSSAGVPRLRRQMEALVQYEKPYLLIEDFLAIRRDPSRGCVYVPFSSKKTKKGYFVTLERASFIHPSSLDALVENIREMGIEILEGFNALHSAGILFGVLVDEPGKERREGQRLPTIRTRKGLETMSDEQEFFIAGFPGVNVVRAKMLLEEFGSPIETITRLDEWTKVSGIGPKTTSSAKKMLYTDYVVLDSENDSENTSESE